jgi:ABC-type transporter MlaC component
MLRLVTLLLLLVSGPVIAQSSTGALSQCLADSTSGKDRKDLARWVFFAMASHPKIKQFTSAAATAAEDETHKVMAGLFTKLLADSCLRQTQAAYKEGGAKAIEIAFQTLGQLAMQELMTNPDVSASMGRFEKQLDQSKLAKVFGN